MRTRLSVATAVAAALLLLPLPAVAQEIRYVGFGLRAGVTSDPDQFHVGAHIDAGEFAEDVRFRPSVELGFGDDVFVGVISLDVLYQFMVAAGRPYAGGGVALAYYDFDNDARRFEGRSNEVEAGFNLFGGFEWEGAQRYLIEARLGLGDLPDFKLTAGISF